jgi:hypothetical protein
MKTNLALLFSVLFLFNLDAIAQVTVPQKVEVSGDIILNKITTYFDNDFYQCAVCTFDAVFEFQYQESGKAFYSASLHFQDAATNPTDPIWAPIVTNPADAGSHSYLDVLVVDLATGTAEFYIQSSQRFDISTDATYVDYAASIMKFQILDVSQLIGVTKMAPVTVVQTVYDWQGPFELLATLNANLTVSVAAGQRSMD